MKLIIQAVPCCDDAQMSRNAALSPELPEPKGTGCLAVVGGGQSSLASLQELKDWPGEIWAINQTATWLRENGIDCWFYSVDPDPDLAKLVSGKVILAAHCDPASFAAASEARKLSGDLPGPTSAVSTTSQALKAGFSHVTFFGCESCYVGTSHVYRDEPLPNLVEVECGGDLFLTKLELILQAEQLASVIKRFPEYFTERCGGFLRAMIEHGEYDAKRGSPNLIERMVM